MREICPIIVSMWNYSVFLFSYTYMIIHTRETFFFPNFLFWEINCFISFNLAQACYAKIKHIIVRRRPSSNIIFM